MKKYSSKQAKKGKLAFRTPSPVRYKLVLRSQRLKKGKKKISCDRHSS